jgi:hypothetical protein
MALIKVSWDLDFHDFDAIFWNYAFLLKFEECEFSEYDAL